MTILSMMRVIVVEAVMLGILVCGFIAFIDEVESDGFHWFKTPFVACWLMIGTITVMLRALSAASENSKDA